MKLISNPSLRIKKLPRSVSTQNKLKINIFIYSNINVIKNLQLYQRIDRYLH